MKDSNQLANFVAKREDTGELLRITDSVSSKFEITEITRQVVEQSGSAPAILFEHVDDGAMPVITNLLGSEARVSAALVGASFDEIADRIAVLLRPELPAGWRDVLNHVPKLIELTKVAPVSVKTGACQQIVRLGRDVDLRAMPIPHFWPQEIGPSLRGTPLTFVDPTSGDRHVGSYPVQVRDARSLLVHWTPHDWAWNVVQECRRNEQQLPVALFLGGDPTLTALAAVPTPPQADKLVVAGYLRGQNVELVKGRSIDLEVPAEADVVIEGFIDFRQPWESAGPLATASGMAGHSGEACVVQVSAVTTRSNPIVAFNVPGLSGASDDWLAQAVDRIVSPLVKWMVPEVVEVHRPSSGARRHILYVSISKRFPQQARKVMNALWGLDWLACCKLIVCVDSDVDVTDERAVWAAVANHCHPGAHMLFSEGPAYFDDHAAIVPGVGHRAGIDATRKMPAEGHNRPWPESLEMSGGQLSDDFAARMAAIRSTAESANT